MTNKSGNTGEHAATIFSSIFAGRIVISGLVLLGLVLPTRAAESGRFESLGAPVRVGGLMGCIAGPNGRGGEALYFNFNQTGGRLFLVQVDPDTGEAHQFNAPDGPGA